MMTTNAHLRTTVEFKTRKMLLRRSMVFYLIPGPSSIVNKGINVIFVVVETIAFIIGAYHRFLVHRPGVSYTL